jgi:hypothetical protein
VPFYKNVRGGGCFMNSAIFKPKTPFVLSAKVPFSLSLTFRVHELAHVFHELMHFSFPPKRMIPHFLLLIYTASSFIFAPKRVPITALPNITHPKPECKQILKIIENKCSCSHPEYTPGDYTSTIIGSSNVEAVEM